MILALALASAGPPPTTGHGLPGTALASDLGLGLMGLWLARRGAP
jgi:hypothetical protein